MGKGGVRGHSGEAGSERTLEGKQEGEDTQNKSEKTLTGTGERRRLSEDKETSKVGGRR